MTDSMTDFFWSACSSCGRRPSNEDSHVVQTIQKPLQLTYAAIFDGHGGASASEYAAKHLHVLLQQQKDFPDNLPKALQQAFNTTDRNYIKQEGSADIFSSAGTTACVLLQTGEKLFFANAGDSRALVGRFQVLDQAQAAMTPTLLKHLTKQVTADHKPHVPEEKQRIEQYGSCVIESQDDCSRVAGMLAVSRAIGDAPFKGCGVIATPEVFCVQQPDVDFIVLACDGLWDVLANEEVGFIVQCIMSAYRQKPMQLQGPAGEIQRLQVMKKAVELFLQSETMQDDASKTAEKELSKIGQYDYFTSESADVRATFQQEDDRFSPSNIARILVKTAIALGSDDNVSVVVGVRAASYQK